MPDRLGPSAVRPGPIARRLAPPIPQPQPSWTTTWQGRVLNPAIIGQLGIDEGIALGIEESSGAASFLDTFTAYERGDLSNPNVVILGGLGVGKSVLAKALYVLRQLMMVLRRAVVIDPKPRGTDGDSEYGELTRERGCVPYVLAPGEPNCTRLNPLDPVILAGGGPAAASALLNTMAELGGQGPLGPLEQETLNVAHRMVRAAFEGRRVPVMEDLADLMPTVVDHDRFARWKPATRDKVDEAALLTSVRVQRALADDLAGLFDGDTSPHVTHTQKLTTYNVCRLAGQDRGPGMGMAMAVINAQLMGRLRLNPDGWRTTLVMDEAWAYAAVAKMIQELGKLARSVGISNVALLQHYSDIPRGSAGEALVREAGTAHIFRQESRRDQDDVIDAFGLDPGNRPVLAGLKQGEHLLRVGRAREVRIRLPLTDTEYRLAETDAAMKGNR